MQKNPSLWDCCLSAFVAMILMVLLSCVPSNMCMADQEKSVRQDIIPNKSLLDQIDRTVKAFYKSNQCSGIDRALSELNILKDMAGKNRVMLIQQLLLYESKVTDNKGMMPLLILKHLQYPDNVIIEALAPHIDADNPKLRDLVRDRFDAIDRLEGGKLDPLNSPNYRSYQIYISIQMQKKIPIPLPFVAYTYHKAPGMALLAFLGVPQQYGKPQPRPKENGTDVLWAEHVIRTTIWRKLYGFQDMYKQEVPSAIDEMRKLSQNKAWWVRLYVAEIMRQHREFRQPEIIEMFKQDSHPQVRKTIASFSRK